METEFEYPIEDKVYRLRTRLKWGDQDEIDQALTKMYTNGAAVQEADDISAIKEIEIRLDQRGQNRLRLEKRLIGFNRNEIADIDPAHVKLLIEKIEEFEKEAKARNASLKQQVNPTTPIG